MATTAWAIKDHNGSLEYVDSQSRKASDAKRLFIEYLGTYSSWHAYAHSGYTCVEVVILEKEEYDKLLSKQK